MPRLGSIIVDGLAFLLVGIALTAVVVGYERNLPDAGGPVARSASIASDWADPDTTGSIAPGGGRGAAGSADAGLDIPADAASPQALPAPGAWIDPPRR
jgi:hypothetical protein